MHNVRVEKINEKADECIQNQDAATIEFNLKGKWRTSNNDKQFGGQLAFPNGELVLDADFPSFLGGEGRAPSALAYCFFGAMSCYGSTFATQAAMVNIHLKSMKISLSLKVDFRGAIGIGSFPPLKEFNFQVDVESSASDDDIQKVKKLTDERCPAIWAMKNPVPFTTSATKTN